MATDLDRGDDGLGAARGCRLIYLLRDYPQAHMVLPDATRGLLALVADAVEIADEAAADLIEWESLRAGDWWDTRYAINGLGDYNEVDECHPINKALSYLDRRGLIERKEGEPHLVRFVEEA